jgi:putative DNA primase/helicase
VSVNVHKLTGADQATIPGVVALTEDTLALKFAAQFGENYRHVPGWGWMRWDAMRWIRDTALQHFDDARLVARELGDRPANSHAESRRIASAKTVGAIIQLARADRLLVAMPHEFDAEPMALNTPDGIIDLRTAGTRPHRRDYLTRVTAVSPDFAATPVMWLRFLGEVFAADTAVISFVRRLLGYFATGEVREQILAFFFGDGRNGKSTLIDLLLWLFGDYAMKAPASLLMMQRGERHPTDIASLAGARLAVSNEIDEGAYWDESKLKELTGDIRLTARFMRQDYFAFNATHKHVVAGNHRPQVRSVDAALRRRLLLIPFTAKFEGSRRDPDMLAKLKAEGPAILAWIVQGAQEWHEKGLQAPDTIRQASEDYAVAMDTLGAWIEECCETDPAADAKASLLYHSFHEWKAARGEVAVSETRWGEQMQGRGFERYRSNGSRYRGIRLTAAERCRVEGLGQTR